LPFKFRANTELPHQPEEHFIHASTTWQLEQRKQSFGKCQKKFHDQGWKLLVPYFRGVKVKLLLRPLAIAFSLDTLTGKGGENKASFPIFPRRFLARGRELLEI
jgi:hypothetical protein